MTAMNIQQINQDIKLRNYELQPMSFLQTSQRLSLFNNRRLINTLKKRNEEYSTNVQGQPQKQKIPEQFRQLNQLVNAKMKQFNFRQIKKQYQRQIERESTSELQWQNFTLSNQQQYAKLHQEYLIHGMIAKSMKQSHKVDRTIKNILINNLKGIKQQRESSPAKIKSAIRISSQVQTNKQKYHQFIKRHVLSQQQRITNIDELQYLHGEISMVWKILSEYFRSYDYAVNKEKDHPQIAVINAAIQMIQSEFRKQMPPLTNEKEISDYIRKKYLLNAKNHEYEIAQDGCLAWGVPYALYRAGAWAQFAISLNDRGKNGIILRMEFNKFQDALLALNPTPQYFLEGQVVGDIFYKQLVAIAKGKSMYDQRLCKTGSLDLVWLTLKLIKIYQFIDASKRAQMQDVVDALLKYYIFAQNQNINSRKPIHIMPYIQFLYLGAYQAIFQYKKISKKSIKPEDYLHFLLALQSKPQLMSTEAYQELVQEIQQQIASYISTLLRSPEQKIYAVFYVLKIPKKFLKNVISLVFSSWSLFNQINDCILDGYKGWKYVKKRFQQQGDINIFQQAIDLLLKNLLQSEQDNSFQIKLVSAAQQLFQDPKLYINFILLCQSKHILGFKTPKLQQSSRKQKYTGQQTIKKMNARLEQILQQHPDLNQQYKHIVGFFQNFRILSDIQNDKNLMKLENFVRSEEYVYELPLLASKDQNYMKNIYEKLLFYKAEEIFFIYIKNVVHAKEKIQYGRGRPETLRDYKNTLKKNLNIVKSQGKYKFDEFSHLLDFQSNL